jgi:hypothetical protein
MQGVCQCEYTVTHSFYYVSQITHVKYLNTQMGFFTHKLYMSPKGYIVPCCKSLRFRTAGAILRVGPRVAHAGVRQFISEARKAGAIRVSVMGVSVFDHRVLPFDNLLIFLPLR